MFAISRPPQGGQEFCAISRPPYPQNFKFEFQGQGGGNFLLNHALPSQKFKIKNVGTEISSIFSKIIIHYKLDGHFLSSGQSPIFPRIFNPLLQDAASFPALTPFPGYYPPYTGRSPTFHWIFTHLSQDSYPPSPGWSPTWMVRHIFQNGHPPFPQFFPQDCHTPFQGL